MKQFKYLAITMVLSSMALSSDEGEVMDFEESSLSLDPASENPIAGFSQKKIKPLEASTMVVCPPAPTEECCPVICEDIHRIQFGGNYTYAWVTPTGNPTTSGSLGGAQFIYEYRPKNWLYAAVAFDYRQGSTDNNVTTRDILDLDSQERFGYTYAKMDSAYRFALFAGLGGRYMSEEVTVGSTSVTFNYTHFYVPVGFLYDYAVNSWFNWGLNFQWRPQIFPTVQIVPLDGARWILEKHIDNILVDMPLTFKFADHFSCIVDPFFEWWHDGQSVAHTITGLVLGLPGNQYYFAGLNVNLVWGF